jgi:signal transduction protein with GAF and PtsI domain
MFTQRGDSSGDNNTPAKTELHRALGRLSELNSLQQILDEVLKFAVALVEGCSWIIYVRHDGELVAGAVHKPYAGSFKRVRLEGWITQHMEPIVIVERAYQDFRFKYFNEEMYDQIDGFLSVPIIAGGKTIGMINAQGFAPVQVSNCTGNMLATIAFLAAAKIEIARLKTEKEQLSRRTETKLTVERAKRILQRDLNISEERAHRTIQLESQHRNKPAVEIAEAIIIREEMKRTSRQQILEERRDRGMSLSNGTHGFESPQSKT